MPRITKTKRTYISNLQENVTKRLKQDIDYQNIIDSFANTNGRVRSTEENKLIIQSLAYLQLKGFSLDYACKEAENMFRGSHNTYKSLWKYYIETGSVNISETHIARGVFPHKVIDIADIKEKEIDSFLSFTYDYTVCNHSGFSVSDLLHYLRETCSMDIDESTVKYLLMKYDFEWTKQSVYYGCNYEQARKEELQRFFERYSHALQLQQQGSHVIVYTDESWSNTGTSFDTAWIHKCDFENTKECYTCSKYIEWSNGEDCKSSISKANVGQRCVFIHAFSNDGLIASVNSDSKYIKSAFEDLEDLDKLLNTSEYWNAKMITKMIIINKWIA